MKSKSDNICKVPDIVSDAHIGGFLIINGGNSMSLIHYYS